MQIILLIIIERIIYIIKDINNFIIKNFIDISCYWIKNNFNNQFNLNKMNYNMNSSKNNDKQIQIKIFILF